MGEPFREPRDAALALLNGGTRLTRSAGSFLGQLAAEQTALTEKQSDWLATLLERAGLPGCECEVRPCTANELAAITGLPREAIQPRTSELRRKGMIVDSDQRRPNPNGKQAIVWTLPQYRLGDSGNG